MSFSYSKVRNFVDCPYKYKLRYIDFLKTKPNVDYNSPLYLGTACHTGIETRSIEKAIEDYKSHYTFLNTLHEGEIVKLTKVLTKAIEQIPEGEYEVKIADEDGFVGYIDLLVPVEDGVYDILDFKYSNNISKYKRSGQIHIYKYYFEKLTGNKIRNIAYVFIPKLKSPYDEAPDIKIMNIPYNEQQINMFFLNKEKMETATCFEKNPSAHCRNCEYFKYCCSNGEDTSEILVKDEPKPGEVVQVSLF